MACVLATAAFWLISTIECESCWIDADISSTVAAWFWAESLR